MKKFLVIMTVCVFALISISSEAGRPKKKSEPAKGKATVTHPVAIGVVVGVTKPRKRRGSGNFTPKVSVEESTTLSEQVSTLTENLDTALDKIVALEEKDDSEQVALLKAEIEALKKGFAESNFITEAKMNERDMQISAYIDSRTHTDLDIALLILFGIVLFVLILNFIGDKEQKKINSDHFTYFIKCFNALRRLESLNKMFEAEDQPLLDPPPSTPK